MHNRDRVDIIRQILDTANGSENTRKTKIMHDTFLTYKQLKEYLVLLTEKDLLNYDPLSRRYKTSAKGITLLRFCNELDEMMEEEEPRRRRQGPSYA